MSTGWQAAFIIRNSNIKNQQVDIIKYKYLRHKNHHPPSVAITIVTVTEINLNSEGDCVCFNNSYLDVKYMVCMQIRLYLHGTPSLLPRSHKMRQSDWLTQELTTAIPRQIHLEIWLAEWVWNGF